MTCREALQTVFADPGAILSTDQVYGKLDETYPSKPWKRNTIYLHLQAFSVNHPGRRHHPHTEGKCFLFRLPDQRYRRWTPDQDGVWKLVDGAVVAEGEGTALEQPPAISEEVEGVAGPNSLSIERDLEESLLQNLSMLEPGLSLYRDGDVDGRQLDTGVIGVIDILAMDKKGTFVVVELKAGKAEDKVCGQIMRYIGWVQKQLAAGKDVRGIIVANEFSEGTKYAVQAFQKIALKKYEIRFIFEDVVLA